MKRLYYSLWVDAIKNYRLRFPDRINWGIPVFTMITLCNSLNFFTIVLWLKFFYLFTSPIDLHIINVNLSSNTLTFIIFFSSPFILLNYFLIFYRKKYLKLLKNYTEYKGRFAAYYIIASSLICYVSLMLYVSMK
jgi:hypothetical protein